MKGTSKVLQQVKEAVEKCFKGKSKLFWNNAGNREVLMVYLEEGLATLLEAQVFESLCKQFVPGLQIQVNLSCGDSPVFG